MWSRVWKVTPYVLAGLLGGTIGRWLCGDDGQSYPEFALWYFVFAYPIFLIGDYFWPTQALSGRYGPGAAQD
jgi:hypothetical protein